MSDAEEETSADALDAPEEDSEDDVEEESEAVSPSEVRRRESKLRTRHFRSLKSRKTASSINPDLVNPDSGLLATIMTNVWLDWKSLQRCPENIRSNRELIITAVKRSGGEAFQFAADNLKQDREVVLEAVRVNGLALQYAANDVREDRAFMLEVVQIDGQALKYASERFRADREVVLAAVRQNGAALVYASEDLLADFELLLEATNEEMRSTQLAMEKQVEDRKNRRDLATVRREIEIEEEKRHERFAVQRANIRPEPEQPSEYDELLQSFQQLGEELESMEAAHEKRMEKFAHLNFF
mmetsp:Transcript_13785/g.26298  ORF Transcript_13785/g.26298 Transcript_13785/m.26298 type:complete len:299 (-) Transcript_13785:38-934(-)